MEKINEDKLILDELKLHFKDLDSDTIEALYNSNNKDLTKTIDQLIEHNKVQNEKLNKSIEEEENEDEEDDDFCLLDDNKNDKDKEKEKSKDDDNINKINNENDDNIKLEKEKNLDNDILKSLIELAPFNTEEEIKEKIIFYNYDYDKVVTSLLDNSKSENSIEENDENKFNE